MTSEMKLRAGVCEVDITPEKGVQIAGDIGKHRGVETVDDPLFARAMVLESAGRKIGFVSLDLCLAKDPYITEIRQRVSRETGIAPDALMIHVTHSHGAPGLGSLVVERSSPFITPDIRWLCGDEGYDRIVVEKTIDVVRQADKNLQPAVMGWARGLEARIAFNRRFVLRDGTSVCHPQEPEKVLYSEGPIDPEVDVVAVKSESGQMLAMLLNYSCHPTHGYAAYYVTAGWPGAWAQGIKQNCGQSCVPLVFTGFAGNVHHHNHLDETHDEGYRKMGSLLTEDTMKILEKIKYSDAIDLDWKSQQVSIPLRRMNPEELAETKQLLAEHPKPIWKPMVKEDIDWKWVYAVSRLDLHERTQKNPNLECQVQVFRMGSMAFVAVPGEPFVEGQLAIKLASPFDPTLTSGNCNSHVGYIPTSRALKGGGYETRFGNWSKLASEALDTLSDTAIEMLKSMKAGRSS